MRITHFAPSTTFQRGMLDTHTVARLDDVTDFVELLEVMDELRTIHSPARILCTLDDVDQCAYTSGHAKGDERLWSKTIAADATDADTDRVQIAHIAAQLQNPALRVEWLTLPDARTADPDELTVLVELNRDPDLALDTVVLVQRAPVPSVVSR